MVYSHSIFLAEIFNAFNPDDLIITTLENAIYLGMKNDVSFIIDWQLVLYEHQSTVNPNMPIRDLFYVACVFSTFLIEANFYLFFVKEQKNFRVRKSSKSILLQCL